MPTSRNHSGCSRVALQRSRRNPAALNITDDLQGIVINLHRSKTDQESKGRLGPLRYHDGPTGQVLALRQWSKLVDGGPVLRQLDRWGNIGGSITGQTVARVVKEYAAAVGLDPAAYSGHSLQVGFVSECDRRGITSSAVRLVTGHQSDAMLNTYQRPRSLFESSAEAFFDDGE